VKHLVLFLFGASLLLAGTAAAATAASTFLVHANVVPRCTIVASDLAFGVYDPLVANAEVALDAAATLTVTCTRGLVGAVAVSAGLHAGEDGTVREMSSGGQKLRYQVYKDRSHTRVWLAGTPGATMITTAGAHRPDQIVLFGRIPAGQLALSGRYTDTLTATVQF
jgi:spore coat protein U-like protein